MPGGTGFEYHKKAEKFIDKKAEEEDLFFFDDDIEFLKRENTTLTV